jgi:hypothetical protein
VARVEVSNRILTRWRQLSESERKPTITLLFKTRGQESAYPAVRSAFTGALADIEERLRADGTLDEGEVGGELSPGDVVVLDAPAGSVVTIGEYPADLPALLDAAARRLEAAGVAGAFVLYEVVAQPLPQDGWMLLLRLRLQGVASRRGQIVDWRYSPEAMARATAYAASWCMRGLPADSTGTLNVSGGGALVRPSDDDVAATALKAVEAGHSVQLTAMPDAGFRVLLLWPMSGLINLAIGGPPVKASSWEAALVDLRDAAAVATDWAVYGCLRRSTRPWSATVPEWVFTDWPALDHLTAENRSIFILSGFEAWRAPDVSGLQMLGAGYQGWTPSGDSWRTEQIGESVIIEATDQAGWFADASPFGQADVDFRREAPTIVQHARRDFAPILITDDDIETWDFSEQA